MKDILNKKAAVVVQGITGKEGLRVAEFMQSFGTNVVAGVRPDKGGEKVLGIPVFDNVAEATEMFPEIKISCIYVPPKFVLRAAIEAIEADIEMIHIIGEGVPVQDTAKIIELSRNNEVKFLGPSSLGIIIPEEFKIGSIGGSDNSSFMKGSVGIISRSGGMSSEVANLLTNAGIGQSAVFHIGGDYLIGTSFADLIEYFQKDKNTKVLLIVGEVGGVYELDFAKNLFKLKKPVVAYIGGQFVETLPQMVPLGHAGAIIGSDKETRSGKIKALKKAKVIIADTPEEIVDIIEKTLK